jgi:hypothetical protein
MDRHHAPSVERRPARSHPSHLSFPFAWRRRLSQAPWPVMTGYRQRAGPCRGRQSPRRHDACQVADTQSCLRSTDTVWPRRALFMAPRDPSADRVITRCITLTARARIPQGASRVAFCRYIRVRSQFREVEVPGVGVWIFCGAEGTMTGEDVLGQWLQRIDLDQSPVPHGTGWLNRIGRDIGTRPPYR